MLFPLGHLAGSFGCWTRRGLLERALFRCKHRGCPINRPNGIQTLAESLLFATEQFVLTLHGGPKPVCVSDSGLFPHIRWGCIVRRSVRGSVRDPGSLLTFSRQLRTEVRRARSVAAAVLLAREQRENDRVGKRCTVHRYNVTDSLVAWRG